MKVALVHDDLAQYGGAERLLAGMQTIWPEAPLYTTLSKHSFGLQNVHTSWMQRLPAKGALYRWFFPCYPLAIEGFDFGTCDVVISSSSRFAHGVLVRPSTLHIWYCHSPSRMAWDTSRYFGGKVPAWLSMWLTYYRMWDQIAAARVDLIIANSNHTRERIKEIYRRESEVVYPFVDTDLFTPGSQKGKFFLVCARLLPYKRIDIAIEACNRLQKQLVVVGVGPDATRLHRMAGGTIRFVSRLTQSHLLEYYRECWALVVPGEEDFGMVALEALACGKPVIAYNRGGIAEVVTDDTGVLFSSQTATSLITALTSFEKIDFAFERLRARASQFRFSQFKTRLCHLVETNVR